MIHSIVTIAIIVVTTILIDTFRQLVGTIYNGPRGVDHPS